MEQIENKIYGRPQNGLIEQFFSNVFEQPQEGDILIEHGNEDYHAHVHLKYQAIDKNGCHNYKVADGEVVETTAEEKAAELAARVLTPRPPDPRDLAIAQLMRDVAIMKGGAARV